MRMRMNSGKQATLMGRDLKSGDEFDVPQEDVERWEKYGFATPVLRSDQQAAPRGRPRAGASGDYNRSDLKAGDDE
jgi:hypothetical protein